MFDLYTINFQPCGHTTEMAGIWVKLLLKADPGDPKEVITVDSNRCGQCKEAKRNVRPISAHFKYEAGIWNGERYTDVTHEEFDRDIKMELMSRDDGKLLLQFIGGPTGYETYNATDLASDLSSNPSRYNKLFCICAGTINRYANCTVPTEDIVRFLNDNNLS